MGSRPPRRAAQAPGVGSGDHGLAGTTDVRFRCAAATAAGGVVAVLHEEAGTLLRRCRSRMKEITCWSSGLGRHRRQQLADLTALGATKPFSLAPRCCARPPPPQSHSARSVSLTQRWIPG